MASRYDSLNNIKVDSDGKRVYKTIVYPLIDISSDDVFIISKDTDRMDLLASKHYGDVEKWWIIAHANKIKGTMLLPPNLQIRIPMAVDKIMKDFKALNGG